MSGIPARCPCCNNKKLWKEQVNAFTSGVPLGNSGIRFSFLSVRGIFARLFKEKLGFYKVTYRCKKCGYVEEYERPHSLI